MLRVIDGDTLLVEARPWPQQTMEVYVRIRGIDAPEMHSGCAKARHPDHPRSTLRRLLADKYFGRILANVTLSDGRNPAQYLSGGGSTGLWWRPKAAR